MRRSLVAVAAALLLLSALPGSALAIFIVPGTIDRAVAPDNSIPFYQPLDTTTTLTVSPIQTGALTYVELACRVEGGADVTVTVGSSTAVGFCSDGASYTRFVFSPPPSVVAGTPYTIHLDTTGTDAAFTYTTSAVTGAGALDAGSPIVLEGETPTTIASFAFLSYVLAPPTTTYAWNPTSVVAGQTTAATLTATTVFPQSYAKLNGTRAVQPNGFSGTFPFTLKLAALPAWFTPTGIECDPVITNCSVANFTAGLTGTIDGTVRSTVVVTLTGEAAPPSNATGNSGQTSGQGCNTWTVGEDTMNVCGTGQSVLGLVGQPTPAPTLPPTTTGGGSSGDPSPWLLLWMLPAFMAAAAVVLRRGEAGDRA